MKRLLALILALLLLASLCACGEAARTGEPQTSGVERLAAAAYPETVPFPDGDYEDYDAYREEFEAWSEANNARLGQPEGYADSLSAYFAGSIGQFLGASDGENRVCSPLNIYMALAMLAELTDGESRRQILELVGADSVETLRSQAASVWSSTYCDDGATTSILASSLWLNGDVSFLQRTMDSLAENYHASSYRGVMGSEELNSALRSWLNEQTGGLLGEQAGGVELSPDTVLALATTVYFRARWADEFPKHRTEEGVFYLSDGTETTGQFMRRSGHMRLYTGDNFSSVRQSFVNGGGMWFILPAEGVTVDELLRDDEAMRFLLSNGDWENFSEPVVHLSVPRFDVVSDISLVDGLKALGVADVFDPAVSDFTPMTTDTDGIYVSGASHAARVTIDEEGCVAAAFTVMVAAAAADVEDEAVFTLDRPFLFVITGANGLPLFAGVVNDPA